MRNSCHLQINSDLYYESSQIIANICKSKSPFGLVSFTHDITYGQNKITMLTKDYYLVKLYAKLKIPTLCTNKFGRTLQNGIYINQILEQQDRGCAILMPLLRKLARKNCYNYGQSSLHLVERDSDCQHLYSLFFDITESDLIHWTINNGYFLHDLIAQYKYDMQDILTVAKNDEYQLELPNFYDTFNSHDLNHQNTITIIHQTLNKPIHLTLQQSRSLILLLRGQSAKQIAHEMQLSFRTIEGYIEKLRQILDCKTSKELITVYYSQLVLLEKQLDLVSSNISNPLSKKNIVF